MKTTRSNSELYYTDDWLLWWLTGNRFARRDPNHVLLVSDTGAVFYNFKLFSVFASKRHAARILTLAGWTANDDGDAFIYEPIEKN